MLEFSQSTQHSSGSSDRCFNTSSNDHSAVIRPFTVGDIDGGCGFLYHTPLLRRAAISSALNGFAGIAGRAGLAGGRLTALSSPLMDGLAFGAALGGRATVSFRAVFFAMHNLVPISVQVMSRHQIKWVPNIWGNSARRARARRASSIRRRVRTTSCAGSILLPEPQPYGKN